MPHEVTMPQLGMAQDAGRLTQWLKAPGDAVAKGDALFEVETDKATMEVEAQAEGYLTHVTARAGEDVPVGQQIARISETAEDSGDSAASATEAGPNPESTQDALPEGTQITMPQLGMAQDSGVLVGWLASLGDKVTADGLLFEVETDKSTMEVPAGRDGYLAATLAQAGEEVPVGAPVAILSDAPPDALIARSAGHPGSAALAQQPQATAAPSAPPPAPRADPPAGAPPSGGRILASPKFRRVAREEGLDPARLARAGFPQPYHMRDIETLRSLADDLPAAAQATMTQPGPIRLCADCAQGGFAEFADWAASTQGLKDTDALLAGLAGASLGDGATTIAVERFGAIRAYHVPAQRSLSLVTASEGAPEPDLLLRDLRTTPLRSVSIGAEAAPVLTLMRQGTGLALTLECSAGQMDGSAAIALLTEFAGRMQEPLRHLL